MNRVPGWCLVIFFVAPFSSFPPDWCLHISLYYEILTYFTVRISAIFCIPMPIEFGQQLCLSTLCAYLIHGFIITLVNYLSSTNIYQFIDKPVGIVYNEVRERHRTGVKVNYYMTVSDAIKVLDVSRITMMKWLKEDRFEGACQLNGSPTSAWHIPVEAVEEMRL